MWVLCFSLSLSLPMWVLCFSLSLSLPTCLCMWVGLCVLLFMCVFVCVGGSWQENSGLDGRSQPGTVWTNASAPTPQERYPQYRAVCIGKCVCKCVCVCVCVCVCS